MNEFTLADLMRLVHACAGFEDVATIDASSADTEFSELGIDSLAVYELATRLQDELGIPISDQETELLTTPNALVGFVNGALLKATR
jgi:acyl carrier protein